MTYVSRLWRAVRVLHGAELRLLVAAIALAVGVPRIAALHTALPFAAHRFGTPETWGWVFAVLGLALLVTSYRWRLTPVGRIIAGIGAVSFVALMAASTSATSVGVDFSLACALAWEAGTANGH